MCLDFWCCIILNDIIVDSNLILMQAEGVIAAPTKCTVLIRCHSWALYCSISFLPGLYCYFLIILQDDCITDSHIKVGLDLLPTSYVTFICDCLWSKEEEKEKESLARMHKNILKIFLIILDTMDEALPMGYTGCCTELYSDTAE